MKNLYICIITFLLALSSMTSFAVANETSTTVDKSIFENQYGVDSKEYWRWNSVGNGFKAGFGLGVLSGLNVFVGKKFYGNGYWNNAFGVRLDYNNLRVVNPDFYKEDDSNAFGVKLNSQSYGGLMDYYPFPTVWGAKGWRVSTGLYGGKFSTEIYAEQKAGHLMRVGNKYFKLNDLGADLEVNLTQNLFGLYLGTGFDVNVYHNIKLFMDIGAIFTKAPDISSIDLNLPTTIQTCRADGTMCRSYPKAFFLVDLVNAIGIDEISKLANVINGFLKEERSIMPMVKIGLMYKF